MLNFVENIQSSNFKSILYDLNKIIKTHPLFHSHFSDLDEDLSQELFLELWKKDRFTHFIQTQMTNAEIGKNIRNIELLNILTAKLRNRYPETYRLSRRISTIIQTRDKFCLLNREKRSLAKSVFGLSKWKNKSTRSLSEMQLRADSVAIRNRNLEKRGRTGDSAIIITNADLECLIVAVFEAIDSPCDIRTIRQLVISRLSVIDIEIIPITCYLDAETTWDLQLIDLGLTPEERYLEIEAVNKTENLASKFLNNLFASFKYRKAKQKEMILKILYHFFLYPTKMTQIQIAYNLGISDSLASSLRIKIQTELKKLGINSVAEASNFEQILMNKLDIFFLNKYG